MRRVFGVSIPLGFAASPFDKGDLKINFKVKLSNGEKTVAGKSKSGHEESHR
jgi:hypothetical protein